MEKLVAKTPRKKKKKNKIFLGEIIKTRYANKWNFIQFFYAVFMQIVKKLTKEN